MFKAPRKIKKHGNFLDCVVVGAVIGFQRISKEKTRWKKYYNSDYVDVNDENIEVLSTWHTLDTDGSLSKIIGNSHFYLGNQYYLAHVKRPNTESSFCFETETLDGIAKELELSSKTSNLKR